LAAFGGVKRDHVIAHLDRGHAGADLDHHARAFMAQNGGEQPLGVGARAGEFVGMADAGGLDLDQHLAGLRALQIDLHDLQRFSGLKGDGGACSHLLSP
jgi:hypothetical protein